MWETYSFIHAFLLHFSQHATPVGGGNAQFCCLQTANTHTHTNRGTNKSTNKRKYYLKNKYSVGFVCSVGKIFSIPTWQMKTFTIKHLQKTIYCKTIQNQLCCCFECESIKCIFL